MDLITDRLINPLEMRDTCIYLLGYDSVSGILDPLSNWSVFIESIQDSIRECYDDDNDEDDSSNYFRHSSYGEKDKARPEIDIRLLTKAYRPSARKSHHRFKYVCCDYLWSLVRK